ncbi:VOC family protein [Stappia sp. F7233]|uniref:VOC family protein n=1 Tax=Stappia albiluteola TaxID=2758565 RepID=A0A839AJ32_9HYPH|nr:VOC family protein [Stappia albiluteola]MBA5779076.1 VOC family protein [Stappia albiluteola]
MEQRISLITLGVDDLAEARRFFEEGLGWKRAAMESDEVAFYQTGGTVLGLFGRKALAEDAGLHLNETEESDGGRGYKATSIAWNGRSEEEVDAAFVKAVKAGARPLKKPEKVFWGGYSGYVMMPGGHLLELAYNPFWPIGKDGSIELPPPAG